MNSFFKNFYLTKDKPYISRGDFFLRILLLVIVESFIMEYSLVLVSSNSTMFGFLITIFMQYFIVITFIKRLFCATKLSQIEIYLVGLILFCLKLSPFFIDNFGGENLILIYLAYGMLFLLVFVYGLYHSDKGSSGLSDTIDQKTSEILKSNSPTIVGKIGSIILGLFLGLLFTIIFFAAIASDTFGNISDIGYLMATIIYFLGVSGAIGLPYTILTRVDTVKSKTIQNTLNTVLEDGLKVEMTLEGILAKVNIADVDSVHFVENKSGKVYSIQLESIKRIAQYLIEKSGKNTFIANELLQEKEFLIQNYESQLSKNDYELLINTLSSWIENGGTVEIIKNHHQ